MDKLYSCHQQRRALLLTLVILLIAPLSMQNFAQSPCTSSITRQATNGKSTNTNIYDDITLAMTNLLGNGTEAAWVMEAGGTFTENIDGTARFQGTVKQFGDYAAPRRMAMDITLGGKSYTPGSSGPYNETGVSTIGWYYYYSLSGSLTGLDALAGGKLSLSIHMHPFQVGIGANQLFSAEDQVSNGAGGWFEWTVVTQPTNTALQFTNYMPGTTISDIAILLSGTPAEPCVTNGSIGDQVYCDINNNGVFDAGDIVATGLTITLCDANFITITTQAVDANGKYLFTNLPAGIYNIKFPEATLDGKPQRELGPINVVLGAGQNFLDADKGYYKASVNPCLNDTEKPVFSNCPANIVKDVTNMSGSCWTITWTAPTAKDNCSTPSVLSNYKSGCCLPVGVTTITYIATDAKGNSATCSFTVTIKKISCTVSGNTISKSCVNNIPVINGSDLGNYEYIWLQSTSGYPSQSSQAIAGATGQNYSLSSCPTVKTYFVRCARPIGCATWSAANESNCITVNANECAPIINCNSVSGNTISKSCANNLPVITGKGLGNYEYMWLESTKKCPSDSKDAIKGATDKDYALPKSVKKTTYFVRCARPVGCRSWGSINESNCITIEEDDCLSPCSVNFNPNKCYRIINKKSGKAVDVYGAGTTNNSNIIQLSYYGNANQQWRFCSLGSGYFKVMSRNSGKYLACHTTSNNSNIYQYDYYSGGYKDWKVECVGNTGYYRLVHRASGKVLDISGGSTADGANCIIYSWHGGDNQLFSIEEVSSTPLYQASASMLAMNATAESDRVRLSWLTNTGYDNDFYTVEKMNLSTGDFDKLSLVNNTQYDDQVQTHAFYDMKPTEGDNFYRVKLSMNDGKDKFTEIKKVTFKRMIGFGAFPNPATDELNVNLSEYSSRAVDIVIYNTFGKVITREHIDNVANPVHKIFVNDFASGQYLIRVSAAGKRDATQQVIIQK